jgi:hypothetical protein
MQFPCYDCQNIGEDTLRCKNYINCSNWCDWAKENNIPISKEDKEKRSKIEIQIQQELDYIATLLDGKSYDDYCKYEDDVAKLVYEHCPKRKDLSMLKVGDSVGGIYQKTKDGITQWYLCEDKINKIVELKSGRKYYTKSKFHPLDADDVDSNTKMQEEAKGYIITREVFGLNDITRPKSERWVEWANENMDKAVSVFE